jgi:hypothetical protein
MRINFISTLILLLLLPCGLHAQGSKKLRVQKLTTVEIKEAEKIFATFKKRLEETNDLRITLRGIPANNWFRNLYIADMWGLDQLIPRKNSIVLKNLNAYRQFYLNLLTVSRIIGLYSGTLTQDKIEDSKEGSRVALSTILSKVPTYQKKSVEFSWATIEGDLKFNSNLKKVIQATRMFDTAIEVVGKELSRLRRERPHDYQNTLQYINIYNDVAPSEVTCEDSCYGFKKGTNYLSKIEGGYVLTVGRVNHRIGILGVEIYSQ